ncbi:MAG TPA: CoA ester lyase [Candidatus Dormibacteraeota bacterium]|nr:CoA ester lyase [Candidatus Dormibacteraeota bacterium]
MAGPLGVGGICQHRRLRKEVCEWLWGDEKSVCVGARVMRLWPPSGRPTRSWMFVPGNKERFLVKAATSDVDCVFLDLEDGVPVAEKAAAREMVANSLGARLQGPLRFVRINSMDSPWWEEDLDAVVGSQIEGICVPKVQSPREIVILAESLRRRESAHSLPLDEVRIVAAIESAAGLVNATAIAAASPRLVGLMFGAEDYALDLGLGTNREGEARELLYHRSAMVAAAAAARVLSIDGVFPNLDDPEGLSQDVLQARRLGFRGKSTFNPRQVEEINRVFSSTSDELAYAKLVVKAFEDAQARGDGSVAIGGQLVDLPIVMRARRLLEVAGGSFGGE